MAGLIFILAASLVLVSFGLFDRILRFQVENFQSDWEKEGKPIGFFWIPEDSSFISGSFQRSVRLLSWTFWSEPWMKNEPTVKKTALVMRSCIFAFWLSFAAFLYFGFAAK